MLISKKQRRESLSGYSRTKKFTGALKNKFKHKQKYANKLQRKAYRRHYAGGAFTAATRTYTQLKNRKARKANEASTEK